MSEYNVIITLLFLDLNTKTMNSSGGNKTLAISFVIYVVSLQQRIRENLSMILSERLIMLTLLGN